MSIALSTHKVAAIAVGVAMVFSFAFVTPASAQTVEDLTAQINSLLATISSLQAQLSAMTGGGATGCYTFTQNHSLNSSGGEVMNVQKFLNMDPATRLASGTDAGAPGYETNYFGVRTKAAVVKFQDKYTAEVLVPVGLTSGTGFWGPSSRAKANALEAARCAGGTPTTPGTPTPTGTGVSVSAAAQPGNSLAPSSAANVPFTKFTVTNNSSAAVTINSVGVELGGLANKAAFSSVVLLDENGVQVGNTRIINSNNQATIGEAVTLQPGQSRTFTVAGNIGTIGTTYAGQVATFSVISINTAATVSGSLPITGAAHTLNGSLSIGSATVAVGSSDPGADDSSEEIGSTNYTFSALKITAGSAEDIRVRSMRWNQSGSAATSDLANVRVVVDGVEYAAAVSADGKYYTANFGSGIVINKGLNKEFVVKGDIIGGTNRTIAFDIYKATDISVTGETYGYGITADDGNTTVSGAEGVFDDESTPAFNGYDVTISAGTVNSVTKSNVVPAGNIAEQVAETPLGAFVVDIKGEGVTVQTVKMAIDTTEASGSDVDADDITNITLVTSGGTVLSGPVDGSATAYTPTGGSAAEGSVSFSSVSFPTGQTTVIVKGQLGSDFDADDTVTIRVNPTDWTSAVGDVTGDTITLSSSLASANVQTVKSAALSATTLTQPAARSVVKGTTDYVWATASLDAADSGENIKVTTVVIQDVTSTNSDANDILNIEIWANLSGGSTADSVRGDRFETRISDTKQFAAAAVDDDPTLSFSLNQQLTVAKNTQLEIAVVGDLSSNAVGTVTTDTHTIDISSVTATGVTTGTDASDSSVAGGGQAMTIAANGVLTVTVDSSSPTAKLVLDNGTEQTAAVFRFAASNVEDLDVDSIKVTSDGADDAVSKYVFYHGSTETKLGEATGGQDTAQVFLNDGQLTVPANGHVLVTVKVVMNDVDGPQIANADTVVTTIAAADDVKTTGKGSGAAVNSTDTSVDAATHTLYEAYPTFAFDNTGVGTVITSSANYLVGKLVVTNVGDKDLSFDNTATANNLEIQFSGNDGGAALDEAVTIKDQDGLTLDSGSISSGAVAFDFSTNELVVPAGGSKTIYIYVDASGLATAADTIQAWLDDAVAADLGFSIGTGTTNYSEADFVFKGDIFGPVHVYPAS